MKTAIELLIEWIEKNETGKIINHLSSKEIHKKCFELLKKEKQQNMNIITPSLNMTPKEKAQELILNMLHKSINKLVTGQYMDGQEEAAIRCALLAVDEILEVTKESIFPMGGCTRYDYDIFWLEVKEEMKKL